MSRFPFLCFFLFSCAILLITGCGDKVKVHGKVGFADGSPLSTGTVVLQNERVSAKGILQSDGTFRVSSVKPNDGVPPGAYKVFITGAYQVDETVGSTDTSGGIMESKETVGNPEPKSLVNSKYRDSNKSGITFDTSKDKELNIIVER